uniref:Insulin-like domain-containing protein n=1 Tax=Sander lucioperca TaxID=283035 RepID=A0A8C9ZC92_SANLU
DALLLLSSSGLQVLCVRMCMFYSTMCLAGWPLSSEAARLRCGTDLLSDLIFVCGDRGIYLGKGSWSGYGSRPRGKGIVDQCCRPSGCELQHLEMYCAKPKSQQQTTIFSPLPTEAILLNTGPISKVEKNCSYPLTQNSLAFPQDCKTHLMVLSKDWRVSYVITST